MIIKTGFIIFMLSVQAALACEIKLPAQMIVLEHDMSGKSVYEAKNCEPKVIDELHQIIGSLDGRVASFQLKEMLASRGHEAEVQPQIVLVHQLSTLIRDQLSLPSGIQVKKTAAMNMGGILALPAGDKVEVSCIGCLFSTAQPLNLTVVGFDGTKHMLFAKADFVKMVKAFKLTTALSSFSSLSESKVLKEEYVEYIPHTDLITDLDSLKFYKTNKPLKAGDIVRMSDLNAINLVRAGIKTEVVLENQMIRIKTSGISRSNGSIGELVEVFHAEKNRKYVGKVVDINKVLVEL